MPNWLTWVALLILMPALARASESSSSEGGLATCANLLDFDGNAQVLDASRSRLQVVAGEMPVPCDGWVSVEKGWVTLKHRFGYQVQVGPSSFVQFKDKEDAILLFRGQVYAQGSGGMGELRILTPNARSKVSRGSMVVLYDSGEDKTQVIAVDGKTSFENRFKTSDHASDGVTVVKAGETSSLDFRLLRTVPTVPRVVASASLREKLRELHVPTRQTDRALAVARAQQQRTFQAAELMQLPVAKQHAAVRQPASEGSQGSSSWSSQAYLERKAVGGQAEGVALLHARVRPSDVSKGKVEVVDPEAKLMEQRKGAEDAEKKRLIEELSRIHSD